MLLPVVRRDQWVRINFTVALLLSRFRLGSDINNSSYSDQWPSVRTFLKFNRKCALFTSFSQL